MQVFGHMELNTTDLEGAQNFYGNVFGWSFDAMPMGNGDTYLMPKAPGAERPFGGFQLKPMPEAPTQWLGYITVDQVKSTTAKVRAAGGQVVVDYVEIPGMGAFAVCLDPQGASFAIWESHRPPEPAPKASKKKAANKSAAKKSAAKKSAAKKSAGKKSAAKKSAAKKKTAKKADKKADKKKASKGKKGKKGKKDKKPNKKSAKN